MNQPFVVNGAIYSDLRTTGEYVTVIPGKSIRTHEGILPFPPGEPFGLLFVVQTTRGPWKFAGKSHETGATWEWDGGWKPLGPSNGENAIAYDTDGNLHMIAPGPDVTSQGFRRNADGSLVSGDATAVVWNGINEYAALGDGLYIGQGAPEHGTMTGVILWDDVRKVHLVLAEGLAFFIRVDRLGDHVAITWSAQGATVFLQTTIDELRALPVLVLHPPAPKDPPVPPVPVPVPEPVPMVNQIEVVKRVRGAYPTPLGAAHPSFLIEVAKATGAKLLRKDGGTHVTLPNGINVSQDILMFGDQGVDILGDGENLATPGWGEKGTIAGEYVDVSGMGTPAPGPAPAPDTAPLQAKIALLEAATSALRVSLVEEQLARESVQHALDELRDRFEQLEATAVKIGHPITVSGRTDTNSWHSHGVKLTGVL